MAFSDKSSADPPEIGIPTEVDPPEDLSTFNAHRHVIDVISLLDVPEHVRPSPTPDTVPLYGFAARGFVNAPTRKLNEIFNGFVDQGHDAFLIATFASLAGSGVRAIDDVLALAINRKLPTVVLAFANRHVWEVGTQTLYADNRMVKFFSPSRALAEDLRVNLWNAQERGDPEKELHIANGLFLIDIDPVRRRCRHVMSWVAHFASMPHNVISIERGLNVLQRLKEHAQGR